MVNVLEADSIIVNHGTTQFLRNVYLKCCQGKTVGLLGRNGSGKSTLLNVIFGSKYAEQKSVRINDEYISDGFKKSRIKLLPQTQLIPSNIRIRDAFKLFHVNMDVLERVFPEGILLLDQKPDICSGGERRFIELILTLYSASQFCLLDEPFSGLAPVLSERAVELIEEVKQDKGIVITDHQYRRVVNCADEIFYLSERGLTRVQGEGQLAALGYLP